MARAAWRLQHLFIQPLRAAQLPLTIILDGSLAHDLLCRRANFVIADSKRNTISLYFATKTLGTRITHNK